MIKKASSISKNDLIVSTSTFTYNRPIYNIQDQYVTGRGYVELRRLVCMF